MSPEQEDRVRVDIPDKDDPDFNQFHRRCGIIIATVEDNASKLTGDNRDNVVYRVEFDDGTRQDFRYRDFRPVSE